MPRAFEKRPQHGRFIEGHTGKHERLTDAEAEKLLVHADSGACLFGVRTEVLRKGSHQVDVLSRLGVEQ